MDRMIKRPAAEPRATTTLSHTVRRFNRFELKYLVTMQEAERFCAALEPYLLPDDHGDSTGSYRVASVYYDSPDFRFHREKVEGIKFRRKLRLRHYGDPSDVHGDTPVHAEIKQRLNRVTQKRRIVLPYRQAVDLCDRHLTLGVPTGDAEVLAEIEAMLRQYNLQPASLVSYTRRALVGTENDVGLRVTFDTNLAYRVEEPSLREAQDMLPLFPADRTIVEIKVNERIPYWLTDLVAGHGLNLVRVSKYSRSIEQAGNIPSFAARLLLG